MKADPQHQQILMHAIATNAGGVHSLSQGQFVVGTSRKNDKQPFGTIVAAVPDDWVKNLKGNDKLQDVYLLVRVPRESYDELTNPKLVKQPAIVDAFGQEVTIVANGSDRTVEPGGQG